MGILKGGGSRLFFARCGAPRCYGFRWMYMIDKIFNRMNGKRRALRMEHVRVFFRSLNMVRIRCWCYRMQAQRL